jgi:hypothetical protein
MLNVVLLSVVMPCIVAPFQVDSCFIRKFQDIFLKKKLIIFNWIV